MPTYPSSLSCYAVYDPAGRPKPATPSYQASYDRSLYFPYGGRPDYRHDPRGLPQSTPIHDVELDSHAGSKRQRTTIACTRCRRRKIKCTGSQQGGGCQACRNAQADLNACRFDRVGTNQWYEIEAQQNPNLQPTSPNDNLGYSGLSIDDGSRPLGRSLKTLSIDQVLPEIYDRPNFSPMTQFDHLSFDAVLNSDASAARNDHPSFADDGVWSTEGYRNLTYPSQPSYPSAVPHARHDHAYQPNLRLLSHSSELAPLNLATSHSAPPPTDRRLPAPGFVGMHISQDSITSPMNSMSGRLASLSIGGYGNDMYEVAHASSMLPPVTTGEYRCFAAASQEAYLYQSGTAASDIFAACTSEGMPNPYVTALPSLLHPIGNDEPSYTPNAVMSTSAPSIAALISTTREESHGLKHNASRASVVDPESSSILTPTTLHTWSVANNATETTKRNLGSKDTADRGSKSKAVIGGQSYQKPATSSSVLDALESRQQPEPTKKNCRIRDEASLHESSNSTKKKEGKSQKAYKKATSKHSHVARPDNAISAGC